MTFGAPDRNEEWAAEEGFQYEVWTDSDKTLAVHYRAAADTNAFVPDRVTVLLDANGDLLLGYYENIDTGSHPAQVLEDVQAIFAP